MKKYIVLILLSLLFMAEKCPKDKVIGPEKTINIYNFTESTFNKSEIIQLLNYYECDSNILIPIINFKNKMHGDSIRIEYLHPKLTDSWFEIDEERFREYYNPTEDQKYINCNKAQSCNLGSIMKKTMATSQDSLEIINNLKNSIFIIENNTLDSANLLLNDTTRILIKDRIILRNTIQKLICNSSEEVNIICLNTVISPDTIPSLIYTPSPPKNNFHDNIQNYALNLNGQIASSNSWIDLFNRSAEFILTESEHKYNHPSAYIYIISAAVIAIKTNSTRKMYETMISIKPNNMVNTNICKLKTEKHLWIWNKVLSGLLNEDTSALITLKESLFSDWDSYLKGNLSSPSEVDTKVNIISPKHVVAFSCDQIQISKITSQEVTFRNIPRGKYLIDLNINNKVSRFQLESFGFEVILGLDSTYKAPPNIAVNQIVNKISHIKSICN